MNKSDFPIFTAHPNLVYLDSAATSQKPKSVLLAMQNFYEQHNATVHKTLYDLGISATELFEHARSRIAQSIGADSCEIVFTKNATESLNLLAETLEFPSGKNEIVLSALEHHANLLPWQRLAKKKGMTLKFIPLTQDKHLDLDVARTIIGERTALVSVTHVSNVLGTIVPIQEIITLAKKHHATTIIDCCQSFGKIPFSVKTLDCDFLVFSGHKIYGPTGIGVLYGKKELLETLPPYQVGGGIVESATYTETLFEHGARALVAGTPPIAEAIGLSEACRYISSIGIEHIQKHERELFAYAYEMLSKLSYITIHSPLDAQSILSFSVAGIHPHDVAELLSKDHICIRAGLHCAQPLHQTLALPEGTCRISFSIFSEKKDIDLLVINLQKIWERFQ